MRKMPRRVKRVCEICGQTFIGVTQSRFCPECYEQRKKDKSREYMRSHNKKYGTEPKTKRPKPMKIKCTMRHFTFEEWKELAT